MKRLLSQVLVLVLIAAGSGCAAKAPKQAAGPLVWPIQPEEPRIAFLRAYYGAVDFRKSSWLDSLLGAQPDPIFKKPFGVFASGDRVYVSETGGADIAVEDTKERTVTYIGDRGIGKLSLPLGIAGSSSGLIYVADANLQKVMVYDATGSVVRAYGARGEFTNPTDVAVNDELKRLYIVDSKAHMVRVYSLDGKSLFQFGTRGGRPGDFNYPTSVAVDKRNGKVYVTDTMNFRVQVFDKDGKFLKSIGGMGDVPGTFTRPKGVAVDSEGNVYVVDAAFNNVQIFNEEGRLLLFFGNGGYEHGSFSSPAGIHVDDQDRIFVVDQLNDRVQAFQYLSEKWKKEHPEEYKKYLEQPAVVTEPKK